MADVKWRWRGRSGRLLDGEDVIAHVWPGFGMRLVGRCVDSDGAWLDLWEGPDYFADPSAWLATVTRAAMRLHRLEPCSTTTT